MEAETSYDHILIRDAAILVRVPKGCREAGGENAPELFDVRTGVQLRQIHPSLQDAELRRGYLLSEESALAILKAGTTVVLGAPADLSKVVTILDMKQRKLDAVVADSILDQVRLIAELLEEFLDAADNAKKEERFWLSQQVLGLVRRFSGRELSELEKLVEWFKSKPPKK